MCIVCGSGYKGVLCMALVTWVHYVWLWLHGCTVCGSGYMGALCVALVTWVHSRAGSNYVIVIEIVIDYAKMV